MRTGIYIRVSTTEQAEEGYSIGAQTERLGNYCKAKDWNIYNIYTDGGFSGSNTKRPALQKLISDVKNRKLDLVLVYKLDRLSRSQKDTLFLIEDVFIRNNVDFVSMNESFDTSTPFGRAMIGILSVFAQLERENIKERTQMGKLERAKDGLYMSSHAPTGYDYIGGKLVINEYEAIQIRELYDRFLKGESIMGLQESFSKKYTTKFSNWKNSNTLRYILSNPLYIGQTYFKDEVYLGQHESMISNEIFEMAQAKLARTQKEYNQSRLSSNYLLTGMLFCAHCGGRYATHNRGNKNRKYTHFYSCYSRTKGSKKMIKDPSCKNKHWIVEELDIIILQEIDNLIKNKEYINSLCGIENKNFEESGKTKKRLDELDRQINKAMDLYLSDSIPMDVITDRIEKITKEKDTLMNSINAEKKPRVSKNDAIKMLENTKNIINLPLSRQKEIVRYLINKIELDEENVLIHWSFVAQ